MCSLKENIMDEKKEPETLNATAKKLELLDRLMCEVGDVVDKYPTYRLKRVGNILFIKPKRKSQQ